MPQVSRRKVQKEIEVRMFEIFWREIADLKDAKETEMFFNDLLTRTEKIMLSKRLAIAIMLLKGNDYAVIKDALKVSTTTVASVNSWLNHGGEGYKKVVEKILKREKFEKLMPTSVSELIEGSLPPKGKDWKTFYRKQAEKQRQHDLKFLL